MTMFRSKKFLFVFTFVVITFVGVFFRLYNLGKFGFFTDELYHVIGAKSLLDVGRPVFPSGDEYNRAIDVTYLCSIMFKFFGESEAAARMPSVFLNVIFLMTSFLIVRKWYNTSTAILYLTVMCFSPFSLALIRQCRMYPHFQLFYFLGAVTFFYGFEYTTSVGKRKNDNKLVIPIEKKYDVKLVYLVLSAILFFLAYRFHSLTINFGIVLLSYVSVMFIVTLLTSGYQRALGSKYAITLFSVVILFCLILIFNRAYVLGQFEIARSLPTWGKGLKFSSAFYSKFLFENYPLFFLIYPISVVTNIKNKKRLGLYLFLCFSSLFLAHSFLFQIKITRYVFYIFPFFIIFAVSLLDTIIRKIQNIFEKQRQLPAIWISLATIMASIITLGCSYYPWLPSSKSILQQAPWPDWKEFYSRSGRLFPDDACVITTAQNSYYYYFGRKPDYYMRADYYDTPNDAEYFTGSVPITNLKEFKTAIVNRRNVYFVSKQNRLHMNSYVDKEMKDFLREHFQKQKLDYRTELVLYKKL